MPGSPTHSHQQQNKSVVSSGSPGLGTMYIKPEDMTNVSRSKLEHLLELAQDKRANDSPWSINRIFASVSGGLFFTALGGLLAFFQLNEFGRFICIIGVTICPLFSLYCFVQEYQEHNEIGDYRDKVCKKIGN